MSTLDLENEHVQLTIPTLHHSRAHKRVPVIRRQVEVGHTRAHGLSSEGDLPIIASERSDISMNPFDCCASVQESKVLRPPLVGDFGGVGEAPEGEAVVYADENDALGRV